jgi:hypothetical protein
MVYPASNAPHILPIAPGHEQDCISIAKKRPPLGVKGAKLTANKRWHPEGIIAINLPWEAYETLAAPLVSNWHDLDARRRHAHSFHQSLIGKADCQSALQQAKHTILILSKF